MYLRFLSVKAMLEPVRPLKLLVFLVFRQLPAVLGHSQLKEKKV